MDTCLGGTTQDVSRVARVGPARWRHTGGSPAGCSGPGCPEAGLWLQIDSVRQAGRQTGLGTVAGGSSATSTTHLITPSQRLAPGETNVAPAKTAFLSVGDSAAAASWLVEALRPGLPGYERSWPRPLAGEVRRARPVRDHRLTANRTGKRPGPDRRDAQPATRHQGLGRVRRNRRRPPMSTTKTIARVSVVPSVR